ncbi:hypothetical protein GX563_10845 [Candidatus Bathyarchaeota archaeon]|nr:hypothetical protein [Candidatus Bathyarchaeota archaeon]
MLILNGEGSHTYTDLMNGQGFTSTGKFNYHLKMLNGLIAKNQDGFYFLTEKGKLAIRLLEEFGEKRNKRQEDSFIPRSFYIFSGLFLTFMLNLFFGFYVIRIDLNLLSPYVFAVLGAVFLVIGERARRRKTMSRCKNQMLGVKVIAIFAGAFVGWVIVYFSAEYLLGDIKPWIFDLEWGVKFNWLPMSFIGLIIGSLVGYGIYKWSKFSKINSCDY